MSVSLPNAPPQYHPGNETQTRSALRQAIALLQTQVLALQPKFSTSSPSGAYTAGTFVWNSTPSLVSGEVLIGWICTVSGNPATIQPCHVLNT